MIEVIEVIIVVSLVLGIVMGAEQLCLILAKKLNINRRLLLNAGIVILLAVASISGVLFVVRNRLEE